MIHSHALIKVACKIFGFMYLVGAVSTLGIIPQGIMMIQTDTSAGVIYGYFALPFLYLIFAYVFLKICRRNRAKIRPC